MESNDIYMPVASRLRWVSGVGRGGALAIVTSACVLTAPKSSTVDRQVPSTTISGISVPADMVAIVPIEVLEGGILLQAEINGRRGTFVLDTGSPEIELSHHYSEQASAEGKDPVTDAMAGNKNKVHIILHTLRLGTLQYQFDHSADGSRPKAPAHALLHLETSNDLDDMVQRPMFGLLGLTALEPFETIIDFIHQRLIVIRLDAAGHRLASVPAYTPTWTVPLVQMGDWWGVEGRVGDSTYKWMIDTGFSNNFMSAETTRQVAAHLTGDDNMLDSLVLSGHPVSAGPFGLNGDYNGLNFPFLRNLGIVGFNYRAHQFLHYR